MPVIKAVQTAWWELRRLADRASPQVRRAFLATVNDVRSVTTLARIEEMVRRGDVSGLQRVLAGEPLDAALRARLAPPLIRLAQEAGQKAVGALPKTLRGVAQFDLLNPRTVDFLRRYSFGLIQQIGSTTREGIRRVIIDAFERGGHPRVQARQIRNMIGLLPRQAAAVAGYRAQLQRQGVRQTIIDRRVQRYADRLLRQRAENIARTETIRASNVGQQALWDQMVDEGLIEKDRARKVWIVTPDDRLCEICAAIPGMNPEGVPVQGGEFVTDLGPVAHPPAHPQCRCAVGLEFRDTPQAPAPPGVPPRPKPQPKPKRVRPPRTPRRPTPAEQRRRAEITPRETPELPKGFPAAPALDRVNKDRMTRQMSEWLAKVDEFTRRRYGVRFTDTTAVIKAAAVASPNTILFDSRIVGRHLPEIKRAARAEAQASGGEFVDRSVRMLDVNTAAIGRAIKRRFQLYDEFRTMQAAAEELVREMERLRSTYPMRGAYIVLYPFRSTNLHGFVFGANAAGMDTFVIHLNSTLPRVGPQRLREYKQTLNRRTDPRPGYNAIGPEETSFLASVLRHEFAHALDPKLQGVVRARWLWGSLSKADEFHEKFRGAILQTARSEGARGYREWVRKESLAKNISGYSGDEGFTEIWPELVAYVTGPGYVPGTLPKPVEEVALEIVRAVKRRGGLGAGGWSE